MTVLHGRRPDEGPAPHLGPHRTIAVLSDVHANVPALTAVLAEPEVAAADRIVFLGDLTWGPEPHETIAMVRALGERATCVRGNADRAVLDYARTDRVPERPRDTWMPARHTAADLDFVAAFHFTVVAEIDGLGAVRFCHGSPRSDTEAITPATAEERFVTLMAGVPEAILVSGHTHLQFDRAVGTDWRSVNPGSVGLPFHDGEPGVAMWALLGPGVHLRRTAYDAAEAVERAYAAADPSADRMKELLLTPPTVAEIVAHAEARVFSD
ncbi:metallophosphoesterase family protein [Actinorhabdospora filicis]|nr:metallophosphoesterase family protein [Actinorhabdospora filicis]